MNLLIQCELTAPPSEVGAFRTVSLYACIFKHYDVLIVADKHEVDYYYKWLKYKGAFDFVKQFVLPQTESGIVLNCKKITYNNLNNIILFLN